VISKEEGHGVSFSTSDGNKNPADASTHGKQQGRFLSQQLRADSFSNLTFESGLCLLPAGDDDQARTR
jgi:hypothetical protein